MGVGLRINGGMSDRQVGGLYSYSYDGRQGGSLNTNRGTGYLQVAGLYSDSRGVRQYGGLHTHGDGVIQEGWLYSRGISP